MREFEKKKEKRENEKETRAAGKGKLKWGVHEKGSKANGKG